MFYSLLPLNSKRELALILFSSFSIRLIAEAVLKEKQYVLQIVCLMKKAYNFFLKTVFSYERI